MNVKNFLISILSLFAVVLVLALFTGFDKNFQAISKASPILILLAMVLSNSGLLVTAFIWRKVFLSSGIELNFSKTLKIVFSNALITNLTPFGHLGGEPFVINYLNKEFDVDLEKIISAVTVSDLINFSHLPTSGLMGILILSPAEIYSIGLIPISKLSHHFHNIMNSMRKMSLSKRQLIKLVIVSHATVVLDVTAVHSVLMGLNLNTDFLPLLFILPVARLANYVPTPGGAGPFEAALAGLLILILGLEPHQAASATIIYTGITTYFGIIVGTISIYRLKK